MHIVRTRTQIKSQKKTQKHAIIILKKKKQKSSFEECSNVSASYAIRKQFKRI